ncbi:hypothetical protein [Agreia sp. Leaf283]|uniref:hypothetical protein n=1 Tax=Agreia sp. Leaf283 TaxID=1736321 RepID=UPI0006F38A93|nr:hypothetical protein [Agreia sp. Leaf283]KQP53855.1 hypothetical protein ASF51_17090 [Agreia sp. Leaf283]
MNNRWTNAIVVALITAGGAALAFFVAANVNAAVLTSWDLGFWGFVLILAAMGSVGVFVLFFAIAVVADPLVRRLPASMSDTARSWMGGAFIAVAATVTAFLVAIVLRGFWLWWPTCVATSLAAGVVYVFAIRMGRAAKRSEPNPWLATTPPF